jgi:hypothetical protein
MKVASTLTIAALIVSAPAAAAADEPGRFVSASLGASVNPSLGHATRKPPALLTVAPELQLSWGMQLGGEWLVLTRVDILGTMIPLGPAGYGFDVGVAWAPRLTRGGWGPLVRFTGGGLLFASGGEVSGPDYEAHGFRFALDAGIVHSERVQQSIFVWGIVAGAHATGMMNIEPCGPGDDCSDAFLGPSLRAEAALLF